MQPICETKRGCRSLIYSQLMPGETEELKTLQSILVTGAGGSAGNNVCWSLRVSPDGKNLDLTGTDVERTSLELNRWIDNAYAIPSASSPRYVTVLNKLARNRKVQSIFPQPDLEVGRVSRERGELEARVFLPDQPAVSICLDKYKALLKWSDNGLRESPHLLSQRNGSAEEKVKSLSFPCWLRAREGAGGLMSCLAHSWKEAYYWVMFHWTQGFHTDFVAEDYLPGRDFCFMSIWNHGTLVTSMVRERLTWVGNRVVGTGGTSKLNRVVHSEKVNSTAFQAVKAVSQKPHGIFCVDLKEDPKHVPRPTEINCRFTTNVHYLTLASIKLVQPELNFPWLAARLCLEETIPACKSFNAVPANLWFTKNTDMGLAMVEDERWRASVFS